MTAWMNSDGHRENLLAGKYNYIGTGTYDADKSGSALQLFAGLNESISTSETSAGTTHFADVDALETEYLICTSATGLVSYVPLDIDYMTKTDDGYRLDLYGNSVSFTLDDKNVYSGFERGAQAQPARRPPMLNPAQAFLMSARTHIMQSLFRGLLTKR